jgi:formylmethanofuran dehydrogenase subunit A
MPRRKFYVLMEELVKEGYIRVKEGEISVTPKLKDFFITISQEKNIKTAMENVHNNP